MRPALALVVLLGLLIGSASQRPAAAVPPPDALVVLAADGSPLAGAQLVATAGPHEGRQLFQPGARALARSDERGRIDLRALALTPERRYVVWAPDLAPALVPPGPGNATLRLLPALPSEGLIRLARGRLAKQRELLAIPHAPYAELIHSARTDDAGRYRFPFLHAGGWSVFLRAGRGRLRPIGTVAAGGALGETRLEDATSIKGRILDGDGTRGASVGAVHVRLRALPGGGAEGQVDFATREDGRFLVSAIPEGVYELEMLDPAWAFEPTRPRVQVERGRARDLPAWFAVRRQRVLGSVRAEDGTPLAGVSVRLVPEPGRRLAPGARAEGTPPVKSDPSGRFVVRGVAPGEGYRLIAAAQGRSPFTSAVFRVDRAEPTQLKPFRLRVGWRVQLRVRDLDGDPVVGAQVTATSARRPSAIGDPLWSDTVREGRTDDTGRLVLGDLPEDDVLLQVRAARYEPGTLVVAYPRVSDMRRAELTLAPATSLDGQLSVPEGGLAGPFVVEAQRRDGGKPVRTDPSADGRFRFADLVDTSYDVRVLRVGKEKHEELLVTVEGVVPGAETLLEIRLPELRALSGSVETLSLDGPVPEVVVETRMYNAGLQRYIWRAAARMRLERDGTRALFTVPGLPPGEYSVRVLQGPLDTGTTTVVLEESDVDGLQLRMPAGARLAGAVRDAEGAALLGARVRLTRLHGEHPAPLQREAPLQRRADERGDFMFEGLAPGQWRVEASDDERAPHVEIVRLHDGEVLVLDDLALGAGARIAGEVADAEGRPLDGVHVHARRFDGDGAPQILRTDAEGRFLARHIRPGAWLLTVDAATVAGGPWIEALVEAVADETATVQFTAGEDGAVRGTVRRRGAPVSGAIVELIHEPYEEAAAVRRYRASTGADGRFAVENLEAGRYTLQLQSGAWRSTQGVDLESGDELDLDLEAHEARLRGRVVTRDGRLVGGASVVATPLDGQGRVQPGSGFVGEGRSDPRGAFVLAGLPPGPYTLAVSAPGLPPGRFHGAQADLPGADFSIEVVLGRGGDVVLRLEDENERGVTGARIWIEDPEGVALHRTPYVTGAAGRLRIEGVTPGPVRLRVHARGLGRPALRALVVEEGGEHAVRMRLLPAGAIRLTVRGETDDPLARTRIDILRAGSGGVIARRLPLGPVRLAAPWGWVPRTGIATIGDLEAGTYIARISAGRRYAVAEVPIEVKTGLTAEVRVTLAPR